jgi:hypothetical protein
VITPSRRLNATTVKRAGKERTLVPPESFRKYFWDANWEDLVGNADRYEDFILCRIADKGGEEAVRWLLGRVSAGRIAEAVGRSRSVSRKSKLFWKNAIAFL